MPFSRIKGSDRGFERFPISSITVAIGDVLMYDYGNEVVILATSACTPERLAGVAVEAATTSDTFVLAQKIVAEDEYIADTQNNSASTDNYHRQALQDEDQVNNGADQTDDTGVFMQLSPVGAAGDKKVRGRFILSQDRAA